MIDLIVFRGAGTRYGGEIFEPLLSEVAPAVQRGKYEIDFSTPKVTHRLDVEYTPALAVGDEASIRDDRTDTTFFGLVREFSHVRSGVVVYSSVVVEVAQ